MYSERCFDDCLRHQTLNTYNWVVVLMDDVGWNRVRKNMQGLIFSRPTEGAHDELNERHESFLVYPKAKVFMDFITGERASDSVCSDYSTASSSS
jgi:hypothetical protein